MAESKEKICSIAGCKNPSKRSFSSQRIGQSVTSAGLTIKDARKRKIYLCQDHWKKVKKIYKKDTRGERLRWGH